MDPIYQYTYGADKSRKIRQTIDIFHQNLYIVNRNCESFKVFIDYIESFPDLNSIQS